MRAPAFGTVDGRDLVAKGSGELGNHLIADREAAGLLLAKPSLHAAGLPSRAVCVAGSGPAQPTAQMRLRIGQERFVSPVPDRGLLRTTGADHFLNVRD
jgi:hypothetical protein